MLCSLCKHRWPNHRISMHWEWISEWGQWHFCSLPPLPQLVAESFCEWLLWLKESAAAAAAAKSLQLYPTLRYPRDGSLPGSPVPGILQPRTLEWVAISFSNAWKWKVKVKSLSRVRLLATPGTAAYQAPPSRWPQNWEHYILTDSLNQTRELLSKLPARKTLTLWTEYLIVVSVNNLVLAEAWRQN